MPAPGLAARLEAALARGLGRITGSALGPYQSAVIRIGFAFTWLCFLLRELPHRHEMYGPDSPWSWDMARLLLDGNHAFTLLSWSDGRIWFELVYALAIASSALLLLGWRTRTMSVLFMVGVLSLQNRNIFMGDGGDNVVHLMSIYLVLTRCGQVWSLDARRAARDEHPSGGSATGEDTSAEPAPGEPATGERMPAGDRTGVVLWSVLGLLLAGGTLLGQLSWGWSLVFWGLWVTQALWWLVRRFAPGEPRTLLDVIANLAHNGTLLVIMVEVCLIYATAGWYKVQGSRWQDGTALYYPMHLDYFSPWPALSDALAGSGLLVMLITYGTVIVQVAFPFTLANRRLKNVLLVLMITEHLSIAVVLGLPFFSLAMIAADAVFLPTGFLRRLGAWLTRGCDRLLAGTRFSRRKPSGTDPEAGAELGAEPVAARDGEGPARTLVR
ncbi:HTTM domain-containing protein [Streptomyces sp. H27-D2]|nr:HTTM domain-containing protein [Streptomyces sp. H27-D2]MEC4017384.1 HTTM domain-containing protein [Streptomyces sp. H27-D2]